MKIKKGEFIFCEDVGKWYKYMGNANLKVPNRWFKGEKEYHLENKRLRKRKK